jgi:hypothetical protein
MNQGKSHQRLAGHKGPDIDGTGALKGHLIEFLWLKQDIGAVGRFIALSPIFLGNFFPGFGVYLPKTYAVSGVGIDDMEPDSLFRGGSLNHGNAA